MVLETIYIVRHAFRMNFSVNPRTGEYTPGGPFPTGIPTDAVLTAHGVQQSKELGVHLDSVQPSIDAIYCSPYYRCIQTLLPTAERLFTDGRGGGKIRIERGVGEFFGRAWFEHPGPASPAELEEFHFPGLIDTEYKSVIAADKYGETIDMLHDRLAYALHRLIQQSDKAPNGPKALLICSHAASIIVAGRVLTGMMPEDFSEDDFQCYTAGLSVFTRRKAIDGEQTAIWDPSTPDQIPQLDWKGGKGVMGGWDCVQNSNCDFLSGGAERGWRFHGDEAFLADPNGFNDTQLAQADKAKASRI